MGGGTRGMSRGMAMGGMGMDPYGGGPYGGMGGYGGGLYGGWVPWARDAEDVGRQQTAMIRLSVELPNDVKPAAGQFVKALVDNLRQALENSYNRYDRLLTEQTQFAEFRREQIEQQMGRSAAPSSPESMKIREQLSTIVDVSALAPAMPFSEAVELLENAVEPPLPIVVLWKELQQSSGIDSTTAIEMDGLSSIRLETALKMVLEAVGGGQRPAVSYQIDNDVVVVRLKDLQAARGSLPQRAIRRTRRNWPPIGATCPTRSGIWRCRWPAGRPDARPLKNRSPRRAMRRKGSWPRTP